MYRFDPRTFAIAPHAGNSPNPHGTSFDYWGYLYANDGTGGRSFQVRPEGKGFKMHELLKVEFRPVAANEILSSEHFPDDMQQDFLICNTIGFLGVKQYDLDRGGDGQNRNVGEVWGTPVKELLNSEDRNFRPTDAIVGADGALYVADWCNLIIGHMQHNIRDPNRDHEHGRIVRLTVKDRPLQRPVQIDGQPIEALLENLKHPINGVRHRTRVELSERNSKEVIAATQKWMAGFDPNNEREAHHLLEALWMHQQHNVKNEALLNQLLNSSIPDAVVAAKTVQHFWYNVDATGASGFAAPAEIKIVDYEIPKRLSPAEQEQFQRGSLIYQRESHCATCHLTDGRGNGVIYPSLIGSTWINGSEERLIKLSLHGLWGKLTVHGKTYDPARGVPPMTAFKNLLTDSELADVLTFVRNNWGNSGSSISAETVARVRAATSERSIYWKPEELLAEHPLEAELALAELGLNPEGFSNKALEDELLEMKTTELVRLAEATGNADKGKELFYKSAAACASCHDPATGTPRIGPDLKSLMTKITAEELMDSVLRPSNRIDKDFAQVTVLTVDGTIYTGIRISEDEKQLVIRNLAQPEPIVIVRDEVEAISESRTSLMPANLAQTLKSREEFLDLMKYVLEVRKH
jgi:putative heme-binding domain-containing protein